MNPFEGLVPALQPWAMALYRYAESIGAKPRVTSVYRSLQQQAVLYERARRGQANYPAAPPGRSKHNYGLAFDMVSSQQEWLGRVWQHWGGVWGGQSDPIHFETH